MLDTDWEDTRHSPKLAKDTHFISANLCHSFISISLALELHCFVNNRIIRIPFILNLFLLFELIGLFHLVNFIWLENQLLHLTFDFNPDQSGILLVENRVSKL